MESLDIKPAGRLYSRKMIGVIWILLAVYILIFKREMTDNKYWLEVLLFLGIGLLHFTPLAGTDRAHVEICDGYLSIAWIDWFRKVKVLDSEIEGILLAEEGVVIRRKGRRPLKIKLYMMNREQKNQVFEFFTDYAARKGFLQQ